MNRVVDVRAKLRHRMVRLPPPHPHPSLLSSVRFLTTGVAIEMNYAAPGSLQRQALFSIGLVLFLFIMLINALLTLVLKGGREARS